MKPVNTMTAKELLAHTAIEIESERALAAILMRAAMLADGTDPALSMLLLILPDIPPEAAAAWAEQLDGMAARLHADTDGPTLARAASMALAQFAAE